MALGMLALLLVALRFSDFGKVSVPETSSLTIAEARRLCVILGAEPPAGLVRGAYFAVVDSPYFSLYAEMEIDSSDLSWLASQGWEPVHKNSSLRLAGVPPFLLAETKVFHHDPAAPTPSDRFFFLPATVGADTGGAKVLVRPLPNGRYLLLIERNGKSADLTPADMAILQVGACSSGVPSQGGSYIRHYGQSNTEAK